MRLTCSDGWKRFAIVSCIFTTVCSSVKSSSYLWTLQKISQLGKHSNKRGGNDTEESAYIEKLTLLPSQESFSWKPNPELLLSPENISIGHSSTPSTISPFSFARAGRIANSSSLLYHIEYQQWNVHREKAVLTPAQTRGCKPEAASFGLRLESLAAKVTLSS